ncbi:type II secretion system F family protein, partial [Virgibacillus halodenitrificans]|nr:type II secretion system F family protein [Virgibacillus halodenitrificans]
MNFQYSGKRLSGQKVKGQIDADTRQAALVKLEQSGLIILRIEETKPWNKDIILNKRIKNKDFVIFLRQYATLIHAGISISDATKTMIMQTGNYALRTALTDMDKQLDQGQALSKAAARHPKVFPSLLVNMIYAGEASGKLDDILNQMADYYEKEYRNKQKIISALLYPAVVGIVT